MEDEKGMPVVANPVFNKGCLLDIAEALMELNTLQREKAKLART